VRRIVVRRGRRGVTRRGTTVTRVMIVAAQRVVMFIVVARTAVRVRTRGVRGVAAAAVVVRVGVRTRVRVGGRVVVGTRGVRRGGRRMRVRRHRGRRVTRAMLRTRRVRVAVVFRG